MNNALSRIVVPTLAALAIAVAGVAFAQSSTAPSGTAALAKQPGSDSRPSGTAPARAAEPPKVIALNFYADWCAGCKALTPKLGEAMKVMAGQPCLTVKLDQTDKESKQAEYMLAVLGLGDLWKEHAGKTGYVLLVNTATKKVVSTITYRQEVKDIKATLMAALKE